MACHEHRWYLAFILNHIECIAVIGVTALIVAAVWLL